MKSRRLTNEIKAKIVDNFLQHWEKQYEEPEKASPECSIRSDFVKDLRAQKFPTPESVNIEALNVENHLRVQFPNESIVDWYFLKELPKNKFDVEFHPVPRKSGVHVSLLDEPDNEHFIAYEAALQRNKEIGKQHYVWLKERGKFAASIKEVLDSVNTTKQFVEIWPEAEDYVPQEVSDPSKISLPALANIEELNKTLSK